MAPLQLVSNDRSDDVVLVDRVVARDESALESIYPLDPLDDARTYQLWVTNDTEDVISAGVLGNRPEPSTFTWTEEVTGFALTREVAGGVVASAGDVVAVIADA